MASNLLTRIKNRFNKLDIFTGLLIFHNKKLMKGKLKRIKRLSFVCCQYKCICHGFIKKIHYFFPRDVGVSLNYEGNWCSKPKDTLGLSRSYSLNLNTVSREIISETTQKNCFTVHPPPCVVMSQYKYASLAVFQVVALYTPVCQVLLYISRSEQSA